MGVRKVYLSRYVTLIIPHFGTIYHEHASHHGQSAYQIRTAYRRSLQFCRPYSASTHAARPWTPVLLYRIPSPDRLLTRRLWLFYFGVHMRVSSKPSQQWWLHISTSRRKITVPPTHSVQVRLVTVTGVCRLSSVIVVCRPSVIDVCNSHMQRNLPGVSTRRRASSVTSRYGDTLLNMLCVVHILYSLRLWPCDVSVVYRQLCVYVKVACYFSFLNHGLICSCNGYHCLYVLCFCKCLFDISYELFTQQLCQTGVQLRVHTCTILARTSATRHNKNSSGDEIANVNFLRRYRTYFKILKKRTYFV